MIEPGYYVDLPEDKHHAIPALSKSGVKHLIVSALQYWANSPANYTAESDDDATKDMLLGKARHCMLLEGPSAFEQRFACKPSKATHPGALSTIEEITDWIAARGIRPLRGKKADLIEQAQAIDPEIQILDVLTQQVSIEGKTMLPASDFASVQRSALAFATVGQKIGKGFSEVTCVWDDPELGCLCKARLDWIGIAPEGHARIVELKDFSHQGRKCSLVDRTNQVFAFERHDVDALFQARAWRYTPPKVHGGAASDAQLLLGEVQDKLPVFPPQNHPELLFLYHRKDSTIPEFVPRTVQLADQSGALTEIGQTAWASILEAAQAYKTNAAKYGFETPWFQSWKPTAIDFAQLPGSYQFS